MTKQYWLGLVLLAALSASGCRMCCPSYDYCGPTEPGESNSECCGMVRRGSSLSGGQIYEEGTFYQDEGVILDEAMPQVPQQPPAVPHAVPHSARRAR